jgi:hypothetical protein
LLVYKQKSFLVIKLLVHNCIFTCFTTYITVFVTSGFAFSENESTALVQYEGGPCAVIAPVQGFVIKNALFSQHPVEDLSQVTGKYLKPISHNTK